MSDLQERRYKEKKPSETVEKVKSILNNLGIEVEEKWSDKSSVNTYSLRICIKGTDIGQNGKGMTREFAMASGYAEFLERLQNGMMRFRIEKPSKDLPFSNVPDEKNFKVKEYIEKNNSFLNNILKQNGKENSSKCEKEEFLMKILNGQYMDNNEKTYTYIPYYSVKNKEIQYIPDKLFSYLYDTNGMCAGNSKEEALIEGISEILERYTAMKIFKEKICLPEIPDEYIKTFPKVYKMKEVLDKDERYYYRLVDCSFGGKYPVAGLYIIEKNSGKFGFKMGAHPDYGIAMERCFTEAAQGVDIFEYARSNTFDFYDAENNDKKSITNFVFNSLSSVTYEVIGDKPIYKFTKMPDVSNLNNKEILKGLVQPLLNDGRDILVRDVDVLGFPSFSIAIPGMSEISFDESATYFYVFMKMQEILKDLKTITLNNIKEVIEMMEIIVNTVGYDKLSILINVDDIEILPCEEIGLGAKYFLGICYIMDKQYNKAAKLLEDLSFIADNLISNEVERIVVKASYYYASAMDKLGDHKEAMKYINMLFSKEIADYIDNSFSNESNIIYNHYKIGEADYVDNNDEYYLPFMKKLREKQKENAINQIDNKKLFS
jgi:YcaO-like protein with predicted kinase domain